MSSIANAYITPEEAEAYFNNIDDQKVTPQMLFAVCMTTLLCNLVDEAKKDKEQTSCQVQ